MSTHLRHTLAALAVILASQGAHATIDSYGLSKDAGYAQTSSSDPTTPDVYAIVASVFGTSPTDYTSAAVTGGASSFTFDSVPGYSLQGFATQAELDAAFPNDTTYTFALTGGTYNGQSATLTTLASDAFPSVVPYLTGNTYSSLQNVNAAASIDLKFNTASQILIQSTSGGVVYESFPTAGTTSQLIAASTLASGTTYHLFLYDLGGTSAFTGFGGEYGNVSYLNFTQIDFTTAPVPEPATFWLLASGLLVLTVKHRKTLVPVRAAR
jgi:hypothetical protein